MTQSLQKLQIPSPAFKPGKVINQFCTVNYYYYYYWGKKLTWRLISPEELQGHGTHDKRRRVQYSTVLVEGRNCLKSSSPTTSDSIHKRLNADNLSWPMVFRGWLFARVSVENDLSPSQLFMGSVRYS